MPFKKFMKSTFMAAILGASALSALGASPSRPYDNDVPNAAVKLRKNFWTLYNQHRTDAFGPAWAAPFEDLDNLSTRAFNEKSAFSKVELDQVAAAIKQIDTLRSKLQDTPLGQEMRQKITQYVQSQLVVINQFTGSRLVYNPSS